MPLPASLAIAVDPAVRPVSAGRPGLGAIHRFTVGAVSATPGDRYGAVLLVANASALVGLILVKPPWELCPPDPAWPCWPPSYLTSDAADLSPRTGAGLAAIRDTPAAVVLSAIHHR